MMNNAKNWSIETAIEQICKCNFECEAGPLDNNEGWRWLTTAAKGGPRFWPGQGVWFEVQADVGEIKLRKWVHFYVVGCNIVSDTNSAYGRSWTYSLSYDLPTPYHHGKTHFTWVAQGLLMLEKPETTT